MFDFHISRLHVVHVPHETHEVFFDESDFPVITYLLNIWKVVTTINVDYLELELSVASKVLLEPQVQHQVVFLNLGAQTG